MNTNNCCYSHPNDAKLEFCVKVFNELKQFSTLRAIITLMMLNLNLE